MKKIVSTLTLMAGMVFANAALAVSSPQQDGTISGVVTPQVATGVLVMHSGNWAFSNQTGDLLICADKGFSGCDSWLTAPKFIRKRFPKAQYAGFQLIGPSNDISVALYLKNAN